MRNQELDSIFSDAELELTEKISPLNIVIIVVLIRRGWGAAKNYWHVLPYEFVSLDCAKIFIENSSNKHNWAKIKFYNLK